MKLPAPILLVVLGATLLFAATRASAQALPGVFDPVTAASPGAPGSPRGLIEAGEVAPSTGSFNYSYPIEVPDFGGLAPQLAASYSSAYGNGFLGPNWTIITPMIRRSLRNGRPLSTNEQLELVGLGGGRLIKDPLLTNRYWVEAQGKRLRVEKFTVGNATSFEIRDSNGTLYKFGTSAGSRMVDPQTTSWVQEWRLETVRTIAGKAITFGYTSNLNQLYPSFITWGPMQGTTPVYRVDFVYETRPDHWISRRTGFAVDTARRLRTLSVKSFGQTLHQYEFRYESNSAGTNRLLTIQPLGKAAATGLPTTTFSYANAGARTIGLLGGFSGWAVGQSAGVTWLDMDRDGFADLWKASTSGQCQYRRNNGFGSFGAAQSISCPAADLTTGILTDLDGDGFVDFAIPSSTTDWTYYRIKDMGFELAGTWPGTRTLTNAVFADVNGDGRPDQLDVHGGELWINTNSELGFKGAANYPLPTGFDLKRLVDINRDGLIDFYNIVPGSGKIQLRLGLYLYTSIDATLVLNQSASATDPNLLSFGDFDADGVTDIVEFAPTGFWFHRGHGDLAAFDNGQFISNPANKAWEEAARDIDGNGTPDLFLFTTDGRFWYRDMAGDQGTGRGAFLASIDNGLGARTGITYDSSGQFARLDRLAGNPWTRFFPVGFPVVSEVRTTSGQGLADRIVRHHPRDAAWDPFDRTFAGFLSDVETHPGSSATDTEIDTCTYNEGAGLDRSLRGIKTREIRTDGNGVTFDEVGSTWETRYVPDLGTDMRLKVAVKTYAYRNEYENGTPTKTDSSFDYDAENRLIRERDNGLVNSGGDERIHEWDYVASDEQTWVRNKVCETRLLNSGSMLVATKDYYYGDDAAEESFCHAGKGWLRHIEEYSDVDDHYFTVWSQTYDALGNPLVTTEGNHSTGLDYDPLGLHPIRRNIWPNGSPLSWNVNQWDDVMGLPLRVTAPDGVSTTMTYDSFGRLLTEAKGSQQAHFHVQYFWSAVNGHPTTTTYVFDGTRSELAASTFPLGTKWRKTVLVMNGLMEPLFSSVWASAASGYVISGWHEIDGRGNPTKTYEPFYSSQEEATAPAANTRVVQNTYDALGRELTRTASNGAQTVTHYGAFRREVQGPTTSKVTTNYDGLGQPYRVFRPVNGDWETTSFSHDVMGNVNLIDFQDELVDKSFTYDSLGRLRDADDPDHGHQTWGYTVDGQVQYHQNGAGQAFWVNYDNAGRRTRTGTGTMPDDANDVIYHYDAPKPGDPADASVVGRLAWVQEPSGEVKYSYDEYGNVAKVTRTVLGVTSTRTSVTSPSGLHLSDAYDDGVSIAYAYDFAGRLVKLGTPAAPSNYWANDELDAVGRSVREHFGNGVSETHSFDSLGMIFRIAVTKPVGTSLYDINIWRNDGGSPLTISDGDGVGINHTANFSYDQAGRLTYAQYDFANPFTSVEYGYDALQNMIYRNPNRALGTMAAGHYNYAERGYGLRQLTSVTPIVAGVMPTSFDYDLAGRQTREFDATLSYDAFDRLTRIDTPFRMRGPGGRKDVNARYTYGYEGLRTSESDDRVVRERWFDADWRYSKTGYQHLLFVGDRLIAQLGPTSTNYYFHQGAGAGPDLVTDTSGNLVEERLMEAFGAPVEVTSPAGSVPAYGTTPINTLDQPTSAMTGYSYHGARWYSPDAARWLTADPLAMVPSDLTTARPWMLNGYDYARQNPVAFWDADGQQPGLYPDYQTKRDARRAAAHDIMIDMINNHVEFHVYGYEYNGNHYYTTPARGEDGQGRARVNPGEFIPDGARLEFSLHGHNCSEGSRGCRGTDEPSEKDWNHAQDQWDKYGSMTFFLDEETGIVYWLNVDTHEVVMVEKTSTEADMIRESGVLGPGEELVEEGTGGYMALPGDDAGDGHGVVETFKYIAGYSSGKDYANAYLDSVRSNTTCYACTLVPSIP